MNAAARPPRPGGVEGPGPDGRADAFGTEALGLTIGPLQVRMEGLSVRQADLLAERYRTFLTAVPAPPDLTVRLQPAHVPHFLRPPSPGQKEHYRMERRIEGGRLRAWSYEFSGISEPGGRVAQVALVEPEGPRFDRGLENFLRVLVASMVLSREGCLLHGATVVRGGRAYVFFGPSGSGKTTVTELSDHDTVLGDDLTLIVRQGSTYVASGIPFGMAHHRIPDTRASFPVASLNRLVQSRRVRREALQGGRGLAEIGSCLPFVMQDSGQADRALAVAARMLRVVPLYRLEFCKDARFWEIVEERS